MTFAPLAISTFAIVLIAVVAVLALLILLGFLGARARARRQAGSWEEAVRSADAALAQAAASDRGWQREAMEAAARTALEEHRPGWAYGPLHLVLVDDRPGIEEDRAHFVAMGDSGDEARVVLSRQGDRWSAERVD
jgi:type II secretory pathway pseudopilin PulG